MAAAVLEFGQQHSEACNLTPREFWRLYDWKRERDEQRAEQMARAAGKNLPPTRLTRDDLEAMKRAHLARQERKA